MMASASPGDTDISIANNVASQVHAANDDDDLTHLLEALEIMDPKLKGNPKYRGVSVDYLQNRLLDEIRAYHPSLGRDSTIHDLEDHKDKEFIRKKSANVTCPIARIKGAAFVHALEGEDNVGDATHMLSYTWEYTVGDIIDTLVGFCEKNHLDPKRTYFWICCFCVNQHNVARGVTTQDLVEEFHTSVTGIGRIVCMMSPWEDPLYLSRVWCIFEIATAVRMEDDCKVTIAMPPHQKESLVNELIFEEKDEGARNIDSLYEALSNTKVQNGAAREEADREYIVDLLKSQKGGCNATNHIVNVYLRKWVRDVLSGFVMEQEKVLEGSGSTNNEARLEFARIANEIGVIYDENGEHDAALVEHRKALAIEEAVLGENHPDTATSYNNIGSILKYQGKFEEALVECRKALAIRKAILGENHPHTATSYNNIGLILQDQVKFEEALVEYHKALAIQKAFFGPNHPDTATIYNNIGSILESQGKFEEALVELRKCLAIREAFLGPNHPDTANIYSNIGSILANQGKFEQALVEHHKALAFREAVLGETHPSTATSYNSIGKTLANQRKFEDALAKFLKALEIRQAVLGDDHPDTADTRRSIANVSAMARE